MDVKKIKELLSIFAESGVAELNYKSSDGEEVFIQKHANTTNVISSHHAPSVAMQAPAASIPASASAAVAPVAQGIKAFESPLVGAFYVAASPNDKPFAVVGQSVKEGDVVCIVESMKVMNKVKIDKSGTIKRVLVNNGQAVEFGEPLFELE